MPVPGHDLLTFLSVVISLFLIGRNFFMALTSEVSKRALGPPRPLSPSVSPEAGRHFELLTGHPCVGFRGEPTLFPGWCKIMKVML